MPHAYDKKISAEYSRLSQTAQGLCHQLGSAEHYYHQLDLLARFGPTLEPFFQYLVGVYRTFSNLAVLQEDYAHTYRGGRNLTRAYTIYRAQSIPLLREQIVLLRAMIEHLPRVKAALVKHDETSRSATH